MNCGHRFIFHCVSLIIAEVINISFRQGIFPDLKNMSRVIPTCRAGGRDLVNNYQLISKKKKIK